MNFESTGFFEGGAFLDGVQIYFDEHHINEVGARLYAEAVRGEFKKIMD